VHRVNQTYFSPKTEKRVSGIEGRGLFAKEPIAQGETVVVKGGYVMTTDQRKKVSEYMGPSDIQIAEDLHLGPITPEDREGGMMHLNHSCEPNLGLQGQIVFVALRDIAKDEELTFDQRRIDAQKPGVDNSR
jgi:SET domain-containing protein